MFTQSLVFLPMLLAACTGFKTLTPTPEPTALQEIIVSRSPEMICHINIPDDPNAFIIVRFALNSSGEIIPESEVSPGSSTYFPANPDGSLSPTILEEERFINTDIKFNLNLPYQTINLAGCLVPETRFSELQSWFAALQPKIRNTGS